MAPKLGRLAATAVLLAGVFGLVGAVQAAEVRHGKDEHLKPNGKGWGELDPTGETEKNAAKFSRLPNNGISYHGGPLMLGTPTVYYIWYGNWTPPSPAPNPTTQTILSNFASYIGGTGWYNINTTYYDGSNRHVSNAVAFYTTQTNDNYSHGTSLNDTAVQNIVGSALASNALPIDPNGVYFVLTSQDVTETSGFCTQYCAWHTHGTYTNAGHSYDIKYGFIGNPARCPSACAEQTNTPNGDLAGDSMASLIAHELSESVTDPDLNAWFDQRGQENADKCAWHFGTTSTASNGSQYNVSVGSMRYLIQQNWVNASGGYCALKY